MEVDIVANIEMCMSRDEAAILHDFIYKNKTDDITAENVVLESMREKLDEVLVKINN